MPQPENRARACCTAQAVNAQRRRIIQIAASGLAAPLALMALMALKADDAWPKPADGDRLVDESAEGVPTPLRLSDVPVDKPVLAYPFDESQNMVRDDSHLNKVVLMRFAEGVLDAESRARSAGGVLAFSAICTHQGCDLKTWSTKDQLLVCFCHSTKYRLLEGGTVASGPASRSLPNMPLKLVGDVIVVAGGFSAQPGGQVS